MIPEQPGRRLTRRPGAQQKFHREALAGAADPVTADSGKLVAPTQGGKGSAGFPQTRRKRWSSQLSLLFVSSCVLMRCVVADTVSTPRPRVPCPSSASPSPAPRRRAGSPGPGTAGPPRRVSQGIARVRTRPAARAPAVTCRANCAAGDQQLGPAEVDDLLAQLPVQRRGDCSPSSAMSPQTTIRRPGASKSRSSSKAARMAVGLEL